MPENNHNLGFILSATASSLAGAITEFVMRKPSLPILAVLAATAFAATGCASMRDAHAQTAEQPLKMTCESEKKNPAVEVALLAMKRHQTNGKFGYCAGTIDTHADPAINANSLTVVWLRDNDRYNASAGHNVYFLRGDGTGALQDASVPDTYVYAATDDIRFSLSANHVLSISVEQKADCERAPNQCYDSPNGYVNTFRVFYPYDAKAMHFTYN